MKLSKQTKLLRAAIDELGKSTTKQNLALYLLAGKKKNVKLVRTAQNVLDVVQGDMYPGSALYAMTDLAISLPLTKDVSIHIPLSDIPEIVAQLSGGLNRALVMAENFQKRESQRAYGHDPKNLDHLQACSDCQKRPATEG